MHTETYNTYLNVCTREYVLVRSRLILLIKAKDRGGEESVREKSKIAITDRE